MNKIREYIDSYKGDILSDEARIDRMALTSESFLGYLFIYHSEEFPLPPADFHIDLVRDLEGVKKFIAVMAYRGSAKSTILEKYAEWILVTLRSKFTVWIGATSDDAKESVANIIASIEDNDLVCSDYDIVPRSSTRGIADKWSEGQISVNGATIIARSRMQKLRGRKYKNQRINVIIVDDLEDLDAVKTLEKRKKTRVWFYSEVINAMKQGVLGKDIRMVMLGNLVHKDCLIANLMKDDDVQGYKVPIVDDEGNISWPAMYPTMDDVDAQKKIAMLAGKGLGAIIWAREYMLKLVEEDDQVIKSDDLHYYDDNWLQRKKLRGGVGVDLAISKKETADYTAMTKMVEVENDYGEKRYLVLKNNIKARLGLSETVGEAKMIQAMMPESTIFYVEQVMYQQAAIEMFQKKGLITIGMTVSKDKRARLMAIAPYIESGIVLFPKDGADDIIEELLGFGIEEHDDQVDSLVHVIDGMLNKTQQTIVSA